MAANQTQVPVIQTSNGDLTQIQQNANKVLRNLNNQLVDFAMALDRMIIIGEVKLANLTLEQFQSIAGTGWVLCDGSSCIGTTYSQITKNNVTPVVTVTGTTAFIKVN